MTTTNGQLHITSEAFLEELGLPERHPYVDLTVPGDAPEAIQNNEDAGSRKWSFADYFIPRHSKVLGRDDDASPCSPTSPNLPSPPSTCVSGVQSCHNSTRDVTNTNVGGLCELSCETHKSSEATLSQLTAALVELFRQAWPCTRSMFHLFFRLFAPLVLMGSVMYLVCATNITRDKQSGQARSDAARNMHHKHKEMFIFASIAALSTSMVMMTDTMYVLEYEREPLVVLFVFTCSLIAKCSPSRKLSAILLLPFAAASIVLVEVCDLDLPTTQPGFYFDETNPVAAAIAKEWPADVRTYDDGRGTPWMVTGDARTGVPFLLNNIPQQTFVRRWVPSGVSGEKEALILDIAFPKDGVHRRNKPIYLILHGLNGGSDEEYVKDFVMRATADDCTAAVLVTRGLMDSPILGDNLPHFARLSDVDAAAFALKEAASADQLVAGVGYSMGAITLANYVATSGAECHLDVAVSISGALDTRQQLNFHRSAYFWQPMLAKTFRDTLIGKFVDKMQTRLTPKQIRAVSRAESIISLDKSMFVKYNNFTDIRHYYTEMGAMGDFVSFEASEVGRIADVSIPLCVVQALDDPIAYWGTLGDPAKVSTTGKGNVMLLLTRRGGHVGWPLGLNPAEEGWRWMNNIALSFVESATIVSNRSTGALQKKTSKPIIS